MEIRGKTHGNETCANTEESPQPYESLPVKTTQEKPTPEKPISKLEDLIISPERLSEIVKEFPGNLQEIREKYDNGTIDLVALKLIVRSVLSMIFNLKLHIGWHHGPQLFKRYFPEVYVELITQPDVQSHYITRVIDTLSVKMPSEIDDEYKYLLGETCIASERYKEVMFKVLINSIGHLGSEKPFSKQFGYYSRVFKRLNFSKAEVDQLLSQAIVINFNDNLTISGWVSRSLDIESTFSYAVDGETLIENR